MLGRIIEGTFTAILVYLVLSKSNEFSTAARAVGGTYTDAVRVLQAR